MIRHALAIAALLVTPAFAADIGPRVERVAPPVGEYLPESMPRTRPVVPGAPVAVAPLPVPRPPVVVEPDPPMVHVPQTAGPPPGPFVAEMECTKLNPTVDDIRSGRLTYHVMFDPVSRFFVVNTYKKLVAFHVTQVDPQDGVIVVRGDTPAHTLFEATFKLVDTPTHYRERVSSFNPRTGEQVIDTCNNDSGD